MKSAVETHLMITATFLVLVLFLSLIVKLIQAHVASRVSSSMAANICVADAVLKDVECGHMRNGIWFTCLSFALSISSAAWWYDALYRFASNQESGI